MNLFKKMIVIVLLLSLGSSAFGEISDPLTRHALQFTGGALGQAVVFSLTRQSEIAGLGILYIDGLAVPLGTALGVSTANYFSGKGSNFAESLVGAYLGAGISWGIVNLFVQEQRWPYFELATFIPPIISSFIFCENANLKNEGELGQKEKTEIPIK